MTAAAARLVLALAFLVAACGPLDVADRGIGGTGQTADRGIGGTGIVGTVTAFGSIWVNGLRVAVPARVPVVLAGRPVRPEALAVGQMVAVLATGEPLVAEEIRIRLAVIGPVTSARERQVTVLGQRIQLPDTGPVPTPGTWIGVSGLRRPDGTLDAGWWTPVPPGRWQVTGPVTAAGNGRVTVGGLTLATTAEPASGDTVRLAGPWVDGQPVLESLTPRPLNPFGDRVDRLVVETWTDRGEGVADGASAADQPRGRVVLDLDLDAGGRPTLSGAGPAPAIGDTERPAPGRSAGPGRNPGRDHGRDFGRDSGAGRDGPGGGGRGGR